MKNAVSLRSHDREEGRQNGSSTHPARPSFWSARVADALFSSGAPSSIGIDAALLICCIAAAEDKVRYTRPVNFSNAGLCEKLGFGRRERLVRARKAAQQAGWLHYRFRGTRANGEYFTKIPTGVMEIAQSTPADQPDIRLHPDAGCNRRSALRPDSGINRQTLHPAEGTNNHGLIPSLIPCSTPVSGINQAKLTPAEGHIQSYSLKTLPPPLTDGEEEESSNWKALTDRLTNLGLAEVQTPLKSARESGCSAEHVNALANYFVAHSESWDGPGALWKRVSIANPRLAVPDGWPAVSRTKSKSQSDHAVDALIARQAADQAATDERMAADRRCRDERERTIGPLFDGLSIEARDQIAADLFGPNTPAYCSFRLDRSRKGATRDKLLRYFRDGQTPPKGDQKGGR